MDTIEITEFQPADRDWLVEAHGTLYAADEKFDDSFGVLVADIIDAFIADHDPSCEAGWVARQDGIQVGCIFCVRLDNACAKLRLFLLLPEVRGLGLGRRMLETCTEFAKSKGYVGMQLWTHESHRAAGALYARNGWELIDAKPVVSFGQPLVEQTWVITF